MVALTECDTQNADGQWIFDSPNTLLTAHIPLRVEATDEAGTLRIKI